MIKTVSIDFSIIFFQRNYLDLTVTKQKSNIRTLGKSWENIQNKITMQLLATYRKK